MLFADNFILLNPRTYTQSHTPTVVQGGGGGGGEVDLPSLEFFICCSIRNDFAVSGKPFIFSTR